MIKTHNAAARCDICPKFFLLLRLEPPVRPSPQAHRPTSEFCHPLQSLTPLDINLSFIVKSKDRRMIVAFQTKTARRKERFRDGRRIVPSYSEFYGGLGK